MPPRARSIGERLYRFLHRWLPSDFRGDFGDAMLADAASGGAAWWTREIPGLVAAIVREHGDALRQDAAYALRLMRRTPGFTIAAVLMLAVGTGVNVAVFSVIDAVLLKSSLPDVDRVVRLYERAPDGSQPATIPLAHVDVIAKAPFIEAVSPITGSLAILRGAGVPHRLDIDCVSPAMFDVAQVRPLVGRVFTADEDRAGGPAVVVLTFDTWHRDFGGDTSVIGRAIDLGGHPNTVIGVMPRGFLGPYVRNRTAGWAPFGQALAHQSAVGCDVRGTNVVLVGRLRPPYTVASATRTAAAANLVAALPMSKGQLGGQLQFVRADDIMLSDVRTPFLVLLGAVGCVLLIACANVANLQLERLVARRRELALRRVLGASRARVIRQTLTENLVLSAAGATVGLGAARLSLGAIVSLLPASIPHLADIQIDSRALAASVACALCVGILVGLAPAWHASSTHLDAELKSARAVTGGTEWLRRGLVIAEVALSVMLLVGAGLLVHTFLILKPDAPGFAADGRIIVQTSMNGTWTADADRLRAIERMSERMASLPDVQSVSVTSYLPLGGMTDDARLRAGGLNGVAWTSWISPGYFADMEMPVTGRSFTAADNVASPPVIALNRSAAAHFFPNADPIGQSIAITTSDGVVTLREIVAVVADSRTGGLDTRTQPEAFIPLAQQPAPTLIYFVLRSREPLSGPFEAALRSAVSDVIPTQIVDTIEPMHLRLKRSVSRPRFGAWLFGVFAAIAVGLSTLGLGAVIAWWVAQRRREIGIRMALGSSHAQVAGLVVKQGLTLAIIGIALGAGAAALSTRLLADWLYGVAPNDGVTFFVCSAGMLIIAIVAAYVPARRAARIDPAITLRME